MSSMVRDSLIVDRGTLEAISIGNSTLQRAKEENHESLSNSIIELLLALKDKPAGRSDFKSADLASFKHMIIQSLPVEFNGNCIFFELAIVKEGGACKVDGMDRKFNRHAWTETTSFNIFDPSGKLSFKYVKCMDHLGCVNSNVHNSRNVRNLMSCTSLAHHHKS